jgi:hypothetical protein
VGPIQDHIGTVVQPPLRQSAMTCPRDRAAARLIVTLPPVQRWTVDIPVNDGA